MFVKNSLSVGLAVDVIAKLTGLPIKKINQMKAKLELDSK